MLNKTSFGYRVYTLADEFGISKVQVNNIINTYISVCREDLLTGHVINFVGLVSVVPNVVISSYVGTTAWYSKKVSQMLNFPYNTVHTIISAYLEDLKDDITVGKAVDIRRIVTLHPLCNENETLVTLHASISVSIKKELQYRNTGVSSVRAHTNKLLKRFLKNTAIEVNANDR